MHSAAEGPEDRASLLVVRAWPDEGSPDGFRARLTQVPDVSEPMETTAVVNTTEALHTAVRQLLEQVVYLDR
jgi:hypothetical protein